LLNLVIGVLVAVGIWIYGTVQGDLYFTGVGAVFVILVSFLAVRRFRWPRAVLLGAVCIAGLSILWAWLGGSIQRLISPPTASPPPTNEWVEQQHQLRAGLEDADPAVRCRSAAALPKLHPRYTTSDFLPLLCKLLRDEDASVRGAAIEALAVVGPRLTQQDRNLAGTLVPPLMAAFDTERDPKQRVAIAAVLAEIDPPQVRPLVATLVPWLNSDDVAVARQTAKVLRRARPDAALAAPELLLLAQKSPSLPLRIEAAAAVAEIDPERARATVPVLRDIVRLIDECTGGIFKKKANLSVTDPRLREEAEWRVGLDLLRLPSKLPEAPFREMGLDPKMAEMKEMESQRREAVRLVRQLDPEKAK
jgi:hypothetical protein